MHSEEQTLGSTCQKLNASPETQSLHAGTHNRVLMLIMADGRANNGHAHTSTTHITPRTESIIVAPGPRPNSDIICASSAGLPPGPDRCVPVHTSQQTERVRAQQYQRQCLTRKHLIHPTDPHL